MDVRERLSLDAVTANTLESSEHLHRYELAASLLGGRRVLDLCCGIGYGALALAETAASVAGVDRDAGAIDTARVVAGDAANVEFHTADAVDFLAEHGDEFDAVVCFEGLEHLERLEAAVELLVALAGRGTAMVLSVPNTLTFEQENPYHVTDFGYEEAQVLFERFDGAVMLHQHVAEGSLISADAEAELDARLVLSEHGEPEYANNFIGVVGLGEAAARTSARAHLTVAPWHNRYLKNLERANRELWQTNFRLGRTRLGSFDSAAAALQGKVRALQERAEEAERLRAELEAVWERTNFCERLLDAERDRVRQLEARIPRERLPRARKVVRALRRLR
jgi:2-polyprenyl-3-methyl-5-hydroxy-6-metoxy-1,4-benzoquinol methylase